MDYARFENSPTGSLVPTAHGVRGFLPHPLPPAHDFGGQYALISRASEALGKLSGLAQQAPNPMLLIKPLQRREALSSSAIEGAYSTMMELALYEAKSESRGDSGTLEVYNYGAALAHCMDLLKSLPLCLRVIREAHEMLMRGTGGLNPGEFRTIQNFIGSRRIETAHYVPPPPDAAMRAMNALELYLQRNDRLDVPHVIEAAMVHYQFESLHPFPDGNGRVGRMLIALLLQDRDALPYPILHMSPYFEEHRETYMNLLYGVSADGAWPQWIAFFCEGVIASCARTNSSLMELQSLAARYRQIIAGGKFPAKALGAVDILFDQPVISATRLQTALGVSYPTALGYIREMIAQDILSEIPGTSHPRFYQAHGIIAASER